MKISPIIFGASGMVGKGVLLECLDSADVEKVMAIVRQPLGISHPKLKEIMLADVTALQPYADILKAYDACFFCLGMSAVSLNEDQYTKITYDITISVAEQLVKLNPQMVFCYVSGLGTNAESKLMWARVKGKTENVLLAMPFKKAYMFRPGLIIPLRGIRSKTRLYNLAYVLMRPIFPILRRRPSVTDTTRLGKAMINAALKGYEKQALENPDINQLAGEQELTH